MTLHKTALVLNDSEQGGLLHFGSGENDMVAIVREKSTLAKAVKENWSVRRLLEEGFLADVKSSYEAAKELERLIPKASKP